MSFSTAAALLLYFGLQSPTKPCHICNLDKAKIRARERIGDPVRNKIPTRFCIMLDKLLILH